MQRPITWTGPRDRAEASKRYTRVAAAAGIITMALAACTGGPTVQPRMAAVKPGDCSALLGVSSEMATITSATSVAASETIGTTTVTAPFCRVLGVAKPSTDSLINFEVWLPATANAWSGRLKTDGTGGYAGATPIARMAEDLAAGFVVAGSDMGHTGGESADWTLGHPEKVKDWGYRAHYQAGGVALHGCAQPGPDALQGTRRQADPVPRLV